MVALGFILNVFCSNCCRTYSLQPILANKSVLSSLYIVNIEEARNRKLPESIEKTLKIIGNLPKNLL